jgi:trimeric autotransporter adhesin
MKRAKGATTMYSHKWTAAFAVAVLFALQSTASNAQQRIGSANTVKPEASGTVAGTLSAGSSVHANETVKTGGSGQAALGFIDKSNLHVGPSSSVRLDKFVYDPNKGTGSVVIDATKGAFRFSTGAQGKGNYQVKTPYGTLGVRG